MQLAGHAVSWLGRVAPLGGWCGGVGSVGSVDRRAPDGLPVGEWCGAFMVQFCITTGYFPGGARETASRCVDLPARSARRGGSCRLVPWGTPQRGTVLRLCGKEVWLASWNRAVLRLTQWSAFTCRDRRAFGPQNARDTCAGRPTDGRHVTVKYGSKTVTQSRGATNEGAAQDTGLIGRLKRWWRASPTCSTPRSPARCLPAPVRRRQRDGGGWTPPPQRSRCRAAGTSSPCEAEQETGLCVWVTLSSFIPCVVFFFFSYAPRNPTCTHTPRLSSTCGSPRHLAFVPAACCGIAPAGLSLFSTHCCVAVTPCASRGRCATTLRGGGVRVARHTSSRRGGLPRSWTAAVPARGRPPFRRPLRRGLLPTARTPRRHTSTGAHHSTAAAAAAAAAVATTTTGARRWSRPSPTRRSSSRTCTLS